MTLPREKRTAEEWHSFQRFGTLRGSTLEGTVSQHYKGWSCAEDAVTVAGCAASICSAGSCSAFNIAQVADSPQLAAFVEGKV